MVVWTFWKLCVGYSCSSFPLSTVISVKAASIQVDDIALMQNTAAGGWMYHTRAPSVQKPVVGGCDYAGVVKACGPDCTKLKVGDRVCGIMKPAEHQAGTWAEQTFAPEKDVVLIANDEMSFVDAAGVQMGALVSNDMIKHAKKKLDKGGCRSLVVGASGAIGLVLLQTLKQYNGHVTAVCSGGNAEKCTNMGANEIIDYTVKPFGDQLVAQKKDKFDVVFDLVGGKVVSTQAKSIMKKGAIFVTAVGGKQYMAMDRVLSCGEFCGACCGMVCLPCTSCCRSYSYVMSQGAYPPMKEEIWTPLVVESGARASIAEEVPFVEAPLRKAMTRVFTHHAGGRVVINLENRE
jgi:NADPH:quinone reductase-like Zn-dependent oxidoreductase